MSILSTGRNSGRRNRLESLASAPTTITNIKQFPNIFHFRNGDEYTGRFAVSTNKQKVTMEGRGTYRTADGQIYEGIWENDCLKDECRITFPDKSVFTGNLEEMVIQGRGKYKFKQKVEIEGEFVNNNVTDNVYLKDPNHHVWEGKIRKDGTGVDFYPLHPFWQAVLNLPSKTSQLFYGEAEDENENFWERPY